MADAKTVADVTDMPAGLDVIPTVPGTHVGGHDVQGTDGKTRTDRPGDILGTPAENDADKDRREDNRARETAKHDYVRAAVDRTNREILPTLGGPIDDGWEPDKAAPKAAPKVDR